MDTLRLNFRNLYADVFWFGILSGSTLYFQSIYAARMGATSFQLGLISAGPAVVALLLTLPAGGWLRRHAVIPASFWSALIQRVWYLAMIALPWLFAPEGQVWAVVGISLLLSIPGVWLSISFNSAFAEVVPPAYLGQVVGRRNALVAISVTLTNVACGQLLDTVAFPLNYQVVFGLGAIGGLMSTYHLGRLRPMPIRSAPQRQADERSKTLLRLDLIRGPFGPFLLAYLFFYTFQYFPLPLFTLALVNELGLSDGQISLGNAMFYLAMMLVSLLLEPLSRRYGHRKVLIASAFFFTFYPLILAVFWLPGVYWPVSILGGAVYALLSGALINRLMERVPADDRPAHMALHNLALNIGVLLGSFAGPLAGELLGLRLALVLAAFFRLAASGFLWKRG